MCPVTLSLILFCWRSLPPQSVTLSRTPMMLTGWRGVPLTSCFRSSQLDETGRSDCVCVPVVGFKIKRTQFLLIVMTLKWTKKIHKNRTEVNTMLFTAHEKKIIAFFFSLLSWKLTSSLLFKPSCWSFYFESNDSAGQSNLTHLPSYNRSSITEDSELGQKTSGDCKNNI